MVRIFPFLFILLWSSAFITTKPIVDNSDPFAALAFRFFFVAVGFYLFSIYSKLSIFINRRNLLESLRYLLLRLGIPTSGYIRYRRGESHVSKYGDTIENKKIAYTLRIPKTEDICDLLNIDSGKFHKFFVYDNYIATRIKTIKTKQYSGILYDLQMKETHYYKINNNSKINGVYIIILIYIIKEVKR